MRPVVGDRRVVELGVCDRYLLDRLGEQHVLRVDLVVAVVLGQLVLVAERDRVERTSDLAVAAKDAAAHVDLVDSRVALARGDAVFGRVLVRDDADAVGRAGGSVARSQMKTKSRTSSFRKNQSGPRKSIPCANGKCQPPRKSVIASPESVIMFTYSAIWNRPQRTPEYSVWYPATSSCSASGRSNGARLVSATPLTRKTRKPTAWGTTYQRE